MGFLQFIEDSFLPPGGATITSPTPPVSVPSVFLFNVLV
jgi:hypothetical protein